MLVVVTGASKGIGFELVKKFSGIKGSRIIAISRNISPLNKLVQELKTECITPIKADITNVKDRLRILDVIKKTQTPLDILINNAGQILNKPFERINEKELLSVYSTNVFAPFLLIKSLVPLFNKKNKSHIVNISSMGGFQGSSKFSGLSAYSSSKAAIAGLSECLAEELKLKNISVNCLAIGAVQTEMLSKAFPGYKAPLQPKEMAEFISDFALNGHKYFNGKIIPVSSTTP
jgi:3-oxoacyl-[acyl-carrier protein] reductase